MHRTHTWEQAVFIDTRVTLDGFGTFVQLRHRSNLSKILDRLRPAQTDPTNYSVQGSVCTGGIHTASLDFDLMGNAAPMFMSGLLSCFYAGSHAPAWSSHFPNYIERWIWRCTCICIASGVPFPCTPFFLAGRLETGLYLNWDRTHARVWIEINKSLTILNVVVFSIFAGMIAISYILARLLIPLEDCISVRSLLRGAFDTGLGGVLARGRMFVSVELLFSFFLLRNYINFLLASLWFRWVSFVLVEYIGGNRPGR